MGRILIVCLSALLLAGCGFRPIYAEPSGAAAARLEEVAVADIPEPEASGFLVQKELTRRFAPAGAASGVRYLLEVDLAERRNAFAVQSDASVTRFDYELTAGYTLTDRTTGATYAARAASVASYNVLNSQFATLAAEQEAREKAARALAERIQLDLALHLAELDR